MLKKSERFHGRKSLGYVFHKGESVRTRQMLIRYITNSQQTKTRVAVVVGKKVSKSAVVRNRIRRRVFETMRQELPSIATPHDIVITVFDAELALMPAAELTHMLRSTLIKAGVRSK